MVNTDGAEVRVCERGTRKSSNRRKCKEKERGRKKSRPGQEKQERKEQKKTEWVSVR